MEKEIADSIQGKKLLFKKNFFDIRAHSGTIDFEKVKNNLHNQAIFSSNYDTQSVYSKRKFQHIKNYLLQ